MNVIPGCRSILVIVGAAAVLAAGCASAPPEDPSQILVEVLSEPPAAPVLYKGQEVGKTPVSVEMANLEELLHLVADLDGRQPVERRVQLLSPLRARVLFRFGDQPSAMARTLGLERVIVFDYSARATFDVDEAVLKPELEPLLEEQARLLDTYFPGVPVYVCGHTDSTGGEEHNLELSLRRAQVVTDFLAGHGVDAGRLRTQGFGEAYPLASNEEEEGRAQNRRTELVLPQ